MATVVAVAAVAAMVAVAAVAAMVAVAVVAAARQQGKRPGGVQEDGCRPADRPGGVQIASLLPPPEALKDLQQCGEMYAPGSGSTPSPPKHTQRGGANMHTHAGTPAHTQLTNMTALPTLVGH